MTPQDFIQREQEIQQATREYPGVEMGEAYRRWKEVRGEQPAPMLSTGDASVEVAKQFLREGAKKPCTQEGCDGTMELEAICTGCVEGRLGYRSKYTCDKCLHRELMKEDYLEILKRLSKI